MSETPRTDAQISVHDESSVGGTAGYNDLVQLSRELERENAELRWERDEQQDWNNRAVVACQKRRCSTMQRDRDEAERRAEAAEAKVKELAQDAERYRWLRAQHKVGWQREANAYYRWGSADHLDAAIDTARGAKAIPEECGTDSEARRMALECGVLVTSSGGEAT